MKKNKVKKLIAKELARFDNRLYDLEVKTGIMPFEIRKDTFTQAITGDIPVKDAEYLKHGEDKTEILPSKFVPKGVDAVIKQTPEPTMTHPELPEKWFVTYDENQLQAINDYRFTKGLNRLGSTRGCIINSGENMAIQIAESTYKHTKITFSDFERFVLKKAGSSKMESAEPILNSGHLEIGKWYINGLTSDLAYIQSDGNSYGFLMHKWRESIYVMKPEEWFPATHKEVEEALINEAKKQGFKKGVEFVSVFNGDKGLLSSDDFTYDHINNTLSCDNGYPSGIFKDGKWAEIISQPELEEEIDFSVPNQLIYNGKEIVLTSGSHLGDGFQGISLTKKNIKNQCIKSGWYKKNFKPIKGEITLKNDN